MFKYGEHLTNYENHKFQAFLRAMMNIQACQIKTACRLLKFNNILERLMPSSSFDAMQMETVSSPKRQ
jgi:hypothetical protein